MTGIEISKYFKDNIDLEKKLAECTNKKEIIKTILKSTYFENLNRDILIFNRNVPYEEQKESGGKEYQLNVNFKIGLALKDEFLKEIPFKMLHSHNYIEMIYVYKGTYSQIINGETITLNTGECCLLNKDVKHKDFLIDKEDTVLYFSLSNEFICNQLGTYIDNNNILEEFFYGLEDDRKVKKQYILFKNGGYEKSRNVVKNIVEEYFNQDIGSRYIITGYMVRLLQLFTNGEYETIVGEVEKDIDNYLFYEIEKYVEENITEISREKLAEELHYNSNYINTIIKKNTNRTYSDYVINKRMEITMELLKNTNYSINRIIKEVGYINKSYFYKVFTSRYGVKPKEFRDAFREKL